MQIKIGTRDSALALAQTDMVAALLQQKLPDIEINILPVKTLGDRILDRNLYQVGGKGLFVKELEAAMLKGEIDLAVHSAKDMPSELPEGLTVVGCLERADFRDVLISRYPGIKYLPPNAVVGTGSPRREAQLRALRDDLQIRLLRGNVPTRLKKYDGGEYDAILLAKAGLDRLHIERDDMTILDTEEMLPAVGQGIIAVEGRAGNPVNELARQICCGDSGRILRCERAFMKQIGGGCSSPMAALAELRGDTITLSAMLEKDGSVRRGHLSGPAVEGEELGKTLAFLLMEQG